MTWRHLRNGPVTMYGGMFLLAVAALILVFYMIKGPLSLHDAPTGKLIERFPRYERLVHWLTAGHFPDSRGDRARHAVRQARADPVDRAFGVRLSDGPRQDACTTISGRCSLASMLAMIVIWARDNVWQNIDALWIRKAGGLICGEHVPSGRFNFGEKTWFWFGVTILGLTVVISGFVMNFPNFGQTRGDMQLANIIHSVSAMAMLLLSFGHIYMGTIGAHGAFASMKTGYVDETWAREHHEQWYNDVKAGKSGHPQG